MQSVGMRSVGRFFRNATKTQKKVQKNAKKSIVLEERENVPKMEIVIQTSKKKTLAESATEKKDVGVWHCWNKKALVV